MRFPINHAQPLCGKGKQTTKQKRSYWKDRQTKNPTTSLRNPIAPYASYASDISSAEFSLEKGFRRKMKSKKFKAQLSRIIFKQASTADRLLENRARQQHELAMENLRRERLVKIDRMYCLLETGLYLSNWLIYC